MAKGMSFTSWHCHSAACQDGHRNACATSTSQAEYFGWLQEYNGFNLCVADLVAGKMAYMTNRGKGTAGNGPIELEQRLYGLSNGVLQDRWPKVRMA